MSLPPASSFVYYPQSGSVPLSLPVPLPLPLHHLGLLNYHQMQPAFLYSPQAQQTGERPAEEISNIPQPPSGSSSKRSRDDGESSERKKEKKQKKQSAEGSSSSSSSKKDKGEKDKEKEKEKKKKKSSSSSSESPPSSFSLHFSPFDNYFLSRRSEESPGASEFPAFLKKIQEEWENLGDKQAEFDKQQKIPAPRTRPRLPIHDDIFPKKAIQNLLESDENIANTLRETRQIVDKATLCFVHWLAQSCFEAAVHENSSFFINERVFLRALSGNPAFSFAALAWKKNEENQK